MRHFGFLPPYYEDATVDTVKKMPVFFEPGKRWHVSGIPPPPPPPRTC